MNNKSYIVFPLKRIASTVYDLFLLLGVWFVVGSLAVWMNGGIVENKWVGPILVLSSTWVFYGYFWINGGKTLGMAVWNFEIYSIENQPINIKHVSIRYFLNLITFFLAGIPLFYMYFSKNNLSISDYFSKTSYRRI